MLRRAAVPGARQVADRPGDDGVRRAGPVDLTHVSDQGGYQIIDVPDLDAALDWAARCPGAKYGRVEVRPLAEF
ncbi:MAG TPA: YciI family protein [Streptosporangiaceae bacterium]